MLYGPMTISPQSISLADNAGIVKHCSCKKSVTHNNKRVSGPRRQTPSWTRSHDPQQALHQKNTAGGFNPLWYFNKLGNQSRNSRQCERTPAIARYYCLSGFQLREPELCGGPRVSASTGLAVSVWHFCQPPSQRETHFALSARSVQGLPSHPLHCSLFYSIAVPQQEDRLHESCQFQLFSSFHSLDISGWAL